eukprot:PITA_07825
MDAYLLRLGFTKSFVDPNLYIGVVQGEPVIKLLYVDDLLVTGVEHRIQECKKQLAIEFNMKALGITHYYLGLEVWQKPSEICLGQDGKSTTSGCFNVGSSMVSWMSKKQDTVALSSVEDEYVVTSEVYQEVVWLGKLLSDLFEGPLSLTCIHCDNESCIRLTEEKVFHVRTKHINNKYHYIKSLVQDGVTELHYIPTNEQVADILTKALPNKKLEYLRNKLGLVDISSLIERE